MIVFTRIFAQIYLCIYVYVEYMYIHSIYIFFFSNRDIYNDSDNMYLTLSTTKYYFQQKRSITLQKVTFSIKSENLATFSKCQPICHSHLLQILLQAFKRCRHFVVGCPAPNANIIEYSTLNFLFNSKCKGRTPITVSLFTFVFTHTCSLIPR